MHDGSIKLIQNLTANVQVTLNKDTFTLDDTIKVNLNIDLTQSEKPIKKLTVRLVRLV
jgi:hypothetical protein